MTLHDHYLATTSDQIRAGWEWYPAARLAAEGMHPHLPTAVGVIAALSPRMKWERNLEAADELIKTGDVKGVLGRNKYKAQLILQHWACGGCQSDYLDIPAVLHGRKVTAFYYAILNPLGNTDPVVDSHMLRAYYGVTTKPTPLRVRAVQDEIRRVAKIEMLPVHVVQAIVWLKMRE